MPAYPRTFTRLGAKPVPPEELEKRRSAAAEREAYLREHDHEHRMAERREAKKQEQAQARAARAAAGQTWRAKAAACESLIRNADNLARSERLRLENAVKAGDLETAVDAQLRLQAAGQVSALAQTLKTRGDL